MQHLLSHVDDINNFSGAGFFNFILTSPENDGPVAILPMHETIGTILKKTGHVSMRRRDFSIEVIYGNREANLTEKLLGIQTALMDAGIINKNDAHAQEMIPVREARPDAPVFFCPRATADILGPAQDSVANVLHQNGQFWVGLRRIDLLKQNKRGLLDIAAGTKSTDKDTGLAQSNEQTLIEETYGETGLDLRTAPVHTYVGTICISRIREITVKGDKHAKGKNDKPETVNGIKTELMAVYASDLSWAKREKWIPRNFIPKSHEEIPKTSAWSLYNKQSMLNLLGTPGTIVRGKACALIMVMRHLGMLKGPEIDAMVHTMQRGTNGSVFSPLEDLPEFIRPENEIRVAPGLILNI